MDDTNEDLQFISERDIKREEESDGNSDAEKRERRVEEDEIILQERTREGIIKRSGKRVLSHFGLLNRLKNLNRIKTIIILSE